MIAIIVIITILTFLEILTIWTIITTFMENIVNHSLLYLLLTFEKEDFIMSMTAIDTTTIQKRSVVVGPTHHDIIIHLLHVILVDVRPHLVLIIGEEFIVVIITSVAIGPISELVIEGRDPDISVKMGEKENLIQIRTTR